MPNSLQIIQRKAQNKAGLTVSPLILYPYLLQPLFECPPLPLQSSSVRGFLAACLGLLFIIASWRVSITSWFCCVFWAIIHL